MHGIRQDGWLGVRLEQITYGKTDSGLSLTAIYMVYAPNWVHITSMTTAGDPPPCHKLQVGAHLIAPTCLEMWSPLK